MGLMMSTGVTAMTHYENESGAVWRPPIVLWLYICAETRLSVAKETSIATKELLFQ
jgi:hypothetical protein